MCNARTVSRWIHESHRLQGVVDSMSLSLTVALRGHSRHSPLPTARLNPKEG